MDPTTLTQVQTVLHQAAAVLLGIGLAGLLVVALNRLSESR